ncbi:MAG: DUF3795 domain-containing protein [Anaerolineales bacterium]|nr:DUF3795 domain-containing protein [Anaerolineales bacterium]
MEPVLTRCGYRCDLCLAYKPNIENDPSNRSKLSDGWFNYFGFRIPEEGIYCEGCREEDPKLIDPGCPVRPCVIAKGLDNCSECGEYICPKLKERIVALPELEAKTGMEISEQDYRSFIRPYENLARLEELRQSGHPLR